MNTNNKYGKKRKSKITGAPPEEKNAVNPIQWFPGHMAKTRRQIKESLPLVDIVIELLDARAPYSSKNPEIRAITEGKPVLTLLNKGDLADPEKNRAWVKYYAENGGRALAADSKSGAGINAIVPAVKEILEEKLGRYREKGMEGRRLKAMIVGIPNVGKSSLLNRLCQNYKAKVEDRPGVTLRRQWASAGSSLDLLDMPGVLWPKFESRAVGLNLAYIGSVKDAITDTAETAVNLCGFLRRNYPALLCERFKIDSGFLEDEELNNYELFLEIGRKRGLMRSAGEIDEDRCASVILGDFRSAKIGRITLEMP